MDNVIHKTRTNFETGLNQQILRCLAFIDQVNMSSGDVHQKNNLLFGLYEMLEARMGKETKQAVNKLRKRIGENMASFERITGSPYANFSGTHVIMLNAYKKFPPLISRDLLQLSLVLRKEAVRQTKEDDIYE